MARAATTTDAFNAVAEPRRREARAQVTGWAPFVIRCALPLKDVLSPSTYAFLVPDEGLSQLVRLHDAL